MSIRGGIWAAMTAELAKQQEELILDLLKVHSYEVLGTLLDSMAL